MNQEMKSRYKKLNTVDLEIKARLYAEALSEGWSTNVSKRKAGITDCQWPYILEVYPVAAIAHDKYCGNKRTNKQRRKTRAIYITP